MKVGLCTLSTLPFIRHRPYTISSDLEFVTTALPFERFLDNAYCSVTDCLFRFSIPTHRALLQGINIVVILVGYIADLSCNRGKTLAIAGTPIFSND